MGAAETGSGKTLAFGIPILMGILNLKDRMEQESHVEFNEEQDISSDKGMVCMQSVWLSSQEPFFCLLILIFHCW